MTPIIRWFVSRRVPALDRVYAQIDEHALALEVAPLPRVQQDAPAQHRRSA